MYCGRVAEECEELGHPNPFSLGRRLRVGERLRLIHLEGKVMKGEGGSPDGIEYIHALSGGSGKALRLCDLLDAPCYHVDREHCGAREESPWMG